jgi:hypothetical protein
MRASKGRRNKKKVSIHLKVFVFKKKKHFGGRGAWRRPDIGKHEYDEALWYQILYKHIQKNLNFT